MLTTQPFNDFFDLQAGVGQRSATFRFHLINGLTGQNLGDIHPLRGAQLTHDTSRTIKRQLSLNLGVDDTAAINPVTDRVYVYMVLGDGTQWPLGRYMFTDKTSQLFSSGRLSNVVLNDEMFLVDQEIILGFDGGLTVVGAIQNVLSGLPVTAVLESSPFGTAQSWAQGSMRGQILEALSVAGDYFSPWFGNDAKLHFIRTFNPANQVPQFDYDAGHQVVRGTIVQSTNLLTAPNRFVVISNTSVEDTPIVGVATVSQAAPNSFANRGFYITETQNLQLTTADQATGVAAGLAQRNTIFETVNLNTPPDPRHDSYDVIQWQGARWLELAWTMQLVEGGTMSHLLRKAYGQ